MLDLDQIWLRFPGRIAICIGARGASLLPKERPLNSHYVYVVDDDRDVRLSLSFMLSASQIKTYPFGSGVDFLEALPDLEPGCILLDIRMPHMDGFQVMTELKQRHVDWPVIVMTGHGEVPSAVRAMKLGAVDFIEKPFSEETLLNSFAQAFDLLEERGAASRRRREASARAASLSTRESEVLRHLLAGRSNKDIASALGISLRTVEMHRSNMMDRLGASSLAEALKLALDAGVEPAGVPAG